MGKIQVVAVNVEGDDGAIAEAIRMAEGFFRNGPRIEDGGSKIAAVLPAPVTKTKREKAKKPETDKLSASDGPPFKCYECEREFDTFQGRNRHVGSHKF